MNALAPFIEGKMKVFRLRRVSVIIFYPGVNCYNYSCISSIDLETYSLDHSAEFKWKMV